MEEGVFSSASTSLTPFFLPPLPPPLPFLSLSLFWSFWLFSLFLLSDLGTQFRLISWIYLANSVPTEDISLASSSLSTSILASRIPAGARFFDPCAFL